MTIKLLVCIVVLLSYSRSFSQQNIWEPVGNRLTGKAFTSFAIDQNLNLYAGTLNGFYKSTNKGDEWDNIIYNGLYGYDIYAIVFNNSGEIFVGTSNGGGIFKSTNEGETWIHLDDPFINFTVQKLDINSSGDLFAAIYDHGMYRSTDNGENWEEVNNGLTSLSLNTLYISKFGSTKDYIFLGAGAVDEQGVVFRSTDNGDSWLSANVPLYDEYAMTFVSNSIGEVYVGTVNKWHHTSGAILKSTNGGTNWFWAGFTWDIAVLVLDRNEYIYSGSMNNGWGCFGIVRSTNNGENWESFNSGLPSDCIRFLVCNSEGILFTAIHSDGVYKTIESVTDINKNTEDLPQKFNLFQNYPNPFNPSTAISYSVPATSFITLKVYDVLGNEIATLVDEEQPAGNYKINFNAENLVSGIYFYRVISKENEILLFTDAKQMILLK